MYKFLLYQLTFICSAFLACEVLLAATSSNKIRDYTDWSVFVESNPKQCWSVSQPLKSKASNNGKQVSVKRGSIQLFVNFFMDKGIGPQIAFISGFKFKSGSTVTFEMNNGRKLSLFTEGEWAFATDNSQDLLIAKELAAGSKIKVTSISTRGTVTEDVFSLRGSKAAIKEAGRRCKIQMAFLENKNTNTASKASKITCEQSISKCNPAFICSMATKGSGSSLSWETNQNYKKYVTEAKRRNLSCNIKTVSNTQKSQPSCRDNVNYCTVTQLCNFATSIKSGKRVWSSSYSNKKFVDYAKKNGMSCNVIPEKTSTVLRRVASGTGFFINSNGYLVTNHHVIYGCNEMRLGKEKLKVTAQDPQNDLAILKAEIPNNTYFKLSPENPQILDEIIAAGYPFGDALSSSIKVTKGIVSSLVGLKNNASELQIDAALQPGNSGGPIINEKGNIVAVAVAKLDASFALENFGVIPENTNFGIKVSTLQSLLDARSVQYYLSDQKSPTKLGDLVSSGTVFLTCWMDEGRIKEMSKSKVMFKTVKY